MTLTLHGATLIDGTGAPPRPHAAILVDGERIVSVTDSSSIPTEDRDVLDLDGLTLLPGLIDAHTHLGYAFALDVFRDIGETPVAEIAARIFRNCELALDAGFTTVRDVSGLDGGVARATAQGLIRGPRIFPSGPALAQTGGHGSYMAPFTFHDHPLQLPGLVQKVIICDGADQVRVAARKAFRRGATQIKMFVSGGVVSLTDELDDTQFTVEELRAAVDEAGARNTYVTAHVHNVRAIRNGLAAGIKCFEHGTYLDEATAAAMAAAGAALVPTLAVAHLMAQDWRAWGLPEVVVPRVAGVEQAMSRAMQLAHAAGVPIGSGSDLLGSDQNRRGLELVLKAHILGPMEAIVSATATNARIMRINDRLGTVQPGMLADLIAVDGDPLAEPELFDDPSRVALVVKNGAIMKDALARSAPSPTVRSRQASGARR